MGSEKNIHFPPGPKGHWLYGNIKDIFADPLKFSANVALKYPGIAHFRAMGRNVYVVSEPEYVKQMLITDMDSFRKGRNYKRLSLIAGQGLITSEGELWKKQRRLAQPGFHKERIYSFIQTFIDYSADLAKRWEGLPVDKTVPMSAEMASLTMRIVGKTLFGIDMQTDKDDIAESVKSVLRFINLRQYTFPRIPMWVPSGRNNKFKREMAHLHEVIYNIIDQRRQGKTSGDDLLDMFLYTVDEETGEKMEREHIRDEIMTIFLAGFETSSVALMWTWYLLSQNPRVWEKFQEELNTVIGDKLLPAPEDIGKLEYTYKIVQESMRVYPPSFTLPREVAKPIKFGEYELVEDSLVLISIYGIHHMPHIWGDPEAFRPERFDKEEIGEKAKHAYIPFGSGQRICIGNNFAMMEIIAALAVLGRKYKPRPKEGYVPKMVPAITINASEGMPMYIERL